MVSQASHVMSRLLGVVQTVLSPVLTVLGAAVALRAILGLRTTAVPLVWAVFSGVPSPDNIYEALSELGILNC